MPAATSVRAAAGKHILAPPAIQNIAEPPFKQAMSQNVECSHSDRRTLGAPALESRRRMVKVQRNTEWNRVPPLLRYEVDQETGCWLWRGCIQNKGYGHVQIDKVRYLPHRLFYAHHKGPIHPNLQACHRCDNPRCVNPHHIFLGTSQDNMTDMASKGRSCRGERSRDAKLDGAKACAIFIDQRHDHEVAADYGVSASLVCMIKRGVLWRHATEKMGGIPPRRKTGPRPKEKNPSA